MAQEKMQEAKGLAKAERKLKIKHWYISPLKSVTLTEARRFFIR